MDSSEEFVSPQITSYSADEIVAWTAFTGVPSEGDL